MKLHSQFNIRTNKRKSKARTGKAEFQCHICYQFKGREDFHNDFTKKSGRSSKCKACGNMLGSLRKSYKRQGYTASEAYYMAKEVIQSDIISAEKIKQVNSYRKEAIYKYEK